MSQAPWTQLGTPAGAATVRARAGQAGAIAAIVMLLAQLLWRLEWSAAGVPSYPEIIVTAVARLTPLDLFGTITESVGSLAKNSLFVAVLVGIVGAGSSIGILVHRLTERRPGRAAALSTAIAASAGLWLLSATLIFPVAHLGPFAAKSSHMRWILTETGVTFALFGLVLGTLLARGGATNVVRGAASAPVLSRRAAVREVAWGAAMLAGLFGLGRLTWRLLRPQSAPAERGPTTAEIIERQQQGNVGAQSSPTAAATPAPTTARVDFAALEGRGDLTPVLTPVADFYKVSKNIADPRVPVERWQLTVGGLVARELSLTYDQLRQRPAQRKITTLCCISNELNGDLISTGEWTGFPLRELLQEAGLDASRTVDVRLLCADDYEESFPLAVAMDPDTLVVTELNGAPLDADHGFPCRLIVPNIYGMKNVKWLERIEAVDTDILGFWETRGWSDEAVCQIWGRIDFPRQGDEVAAGPLVAAGMAAAGDRGIYRVEVSLDGGTTWAAATLEPSLNEPFTWVRWAFPFDARPGEQTLTIRAIDGDGVLMDETRRPPLPDGATGWPTRTFTVT